MSFMGAVFVSAKHPAYRKAKKYLTLSVFQVGTQESEEFLAYEEVDGGIYIPRDYARRLGMKPETVAFGYQLDDDCMKPVRLRDEQVPFVESLEYTAQGVMQGECSFADIRAEAGTGKGKTVMALELCRRLQMTTLVIVDQEFLRDQWIERARDLFGVDESEIGIVQGKRADWEDKSIVVGMIQTLHKKEMSPEFYSYFGIVIFDESHTVGAKQFSKILFKLPAAIRIGVSATSKRGDELDTVLDTNLGPVQIVLSTGHKASTVRYVPYAGNTYSWYANTSPKSGRYISEIAADGRRNLLIATLIHSLYLEGHHVLGVSDRVEHVEDMKTLLEYMGVPADEIGVVTAKATQFKYAKNNKPARKPQGYVRGTPYTPISIQRVERRAKAADLSKAKDESRIVLATYGKFEKGVDVPHLSAGVDMTPRSKAVQLHGRILREHKDKLEPVWVTILDELSYRAIHQFASRITEYVKSNAEVYRWTLGQPPIHEPANRLSAEARRSARKLKGVKITTKRDGNFTLLMPTTENVSKTAHGGRIERTTRRVQTPSRTGSHAQRPR